MDTKTGYIDPRFAVRTNASIDLQLRATTTIEAEITENDERVGDGEAEYKRKEGSRQHTLSLTLTLVCAGRLPPVTREQILRFHPVTKDVFRHYTRSSGHRRTDSVFHPVTKGRIPQFQPVIRSPENTFCGSRPIIQSTQIAFVMVRSGMMFVFHVCEESKRSGVSFVRSEDLWRKEFLEGNSRSSMSK
ncbi:unnamed protein product [Sphagnum balticum]